MNNSRIALLFLLFSLTNCTLTKKQQLEEARQVIQEKQRTIEGKENQQTRTIAILKKRLVKYGVQNPEFSRTENKFNIEFPRRTDVEGTQMSFGISIFRSFLIFLKH
ncbi:MAG TPA: hypothetical protein ENJ53_04440 [Phaeodactylibacter sp.]|nr:hypothetical protein [Phaeodactylibacter sp.]